MKEDLYNLRKELEEAASFTEETEIATVEAANTHKLNSFRGRNSNDFIN